MEGLAVPAEFLSGAVGYIPEMGELGDMGSDLDAGVAVGIPALDAVQMVLHVEAKAAIAAFPGAALMPAEADRDWPTPLDTSGQDTVYVGRIRDDLTDERGLTLWCCGDQVRKGAASNAVQILKLLTE